MNNEKIKILKMVEDGKISVEEAEQLLEKFNASQANQQKTFNQKFLKVFVVDGQDTKVNIRVPLALAEVALKLVPEDKLVVKGVQINPAEIIAMIEAGADGHLVDVEAEDKGKRVIVKVYID